MPAERQDQDSPWKEALERYFESFLALCFPEVHAGIDWDRGYEFLDKELQKVVRDAKLGRRLADKLVKVWRRGESSLGDTGETWLLVHVEVQGEPEEEFAKRMFVYHYRIFDRFNRRVVSLAVLGDQQATWRPDRYGYALWGCRLALEFPVRKLLEYNLRWEELEQSSNPFAVVVMAHLKAQATQRDPENRFRSKLTLVRALYERGWPRQDILELFRFVDWLLILPPELEQQFEVALAEHEEEKQMPYITSIERRATDRGVRQGREEGRQEGRGEGVRESVLEALATRFGAVPDTIAGGIQANEDVDALRNLLRTAVTVGSLAEFEEALRSTRLG
jgi:hypothetical protein